MNYNRGQTLTPALSHPMGEGEASAGRGCSACHGLLHKLNWAEWSKNERGRVVADSPA